MASILQVNGKWRALVRKAGHKAQCRTFASKAEAEKWARRIETSMDTGEAPKQTHGLTIGDVLKAYRRLREEARPIRDDSNEFYMLKFLEKGLGDVLLDRASPDTIVAYARMRRDEGAGPYTVNMDISKLGTVIRYGCAALRVSPRDIVGAARPLLSHLRLIGSGGKRERRPTQDELESVIQYLKDERGQIYADAVEFAAASAMRRGEICALAWEDIDHKTRIATIPRKDPRQGKRIEKVPLLERSWAVLVRQEAREGLVFGCHEQTLSKYFNQACKSLGIPDLHFHDLRHEGTSAMFEEGYSIEQVALVTGHRDWKQLKRYTNLKPESLTRPAGASSQDIQPRPESQPNASRRQRKS